MSHHNPHERPFSWLLGGKGYAFTGAGVIGEGSALPTAAKTGQFYYHTPTGRKFRMGYDGSSWVPLFADGTTALYIDPTAGEDSQNKGTGTGTDAFATIPYALTQLPSSFTGDVVFNLANGTYTSGFTVQGKQAAGAYTITFQSTLTTYQSLTAGAGSAAGTGATQGTVVRGSGSWTVNEVQNKIIRFTSGVNSGISRLIDSNSAGTITVVGVWPNGAPANGDAFVVEDWSSGAIIAPTSGHAITLKNGNTKVILDRIYSNPGSANDALSVDDRTTWAAKRCRFNRGVSLYTGSKGSIGEFTDGQPCFLDGSAAYGYWQDRFVNVQGRSEIEILQSKILCTFAAPFGYVYGVNTNNGSFTYLDNGTVVEGQQTFGSSGINSEGLRHTDGSTGTVEGGYVSDVRVRGWDRGVRAQNDSVATTYNVSFSSNTTDESADGTTGGYIV